jgi:hypothetical protein
MIEIGTLRTLVDRGRERRPELASRIERAAFIVLMRRIEPVEGGNWLVESDSEPGKVYAVTSDACDCQDYYRAPKGYCKHRIAVAISIRGDEVERERRQRRQRERLSDERVSVNSALAFAGAHR